MERSECRRYDPCLKNIVTASNDIRKFLEYEISLSTLRDWKKNGVREFFTILELDLTTSGFVSENMPLKAKLAAVAAAARTLPPSKPSKPREFHPQLLTDPKLSLSTHPARVSTLDKHSSGQKAVATFGTLFEANRRT